MTNLPRIQPSSQLSQLSTSGTNKMASSNSQKVLSTWRCSQVIMDLDSSQRVASSHMCGPRFNKISNTSIFTQLPRLDSSLKLRSTQMILKCAGRVIQVISKLSLMKQLETLPKWKLQELKSSNQCSMLPKPGWWEIGKVLKMRRLTDNVLIFSRKCSIRSLLEKRIFTECLRTTNSLNSSESSRHG